MWDEIPNTRTPVRYFSKNNGKIKLGERKMLYRTENAGLKACCVADTDWLSTDYIYEHLNFDQCPIWLKSTEKKSSFATFYYLPSDINTNITTLPI